MTRNLLLLNDYCNTKTNLQSTMRPANSQIKNAMRWALFIWCAAIVPANAKIDFTTEIQPLLESACLRCHCEDHDDGGLRLDSLQAILAGGDSGPVLVPGNPEDSPLFTMTVLAADDAEIMPPEDAPLAPSQTARLRQWIKEGANWPKDARLKIQPRIDFKKHIQPILETRCVSCHQDDLSEGDFDLSTHSKTLKTGDNKPALLAFHPKKSPLYTRTIVAADDDLIMPPDGSGQPLSREETEHLRLWITQGAIWPTGLELQPVERRDTENESHDNFKLIRDIHKSILDRSREKNADDMADYSSQIPSTKATYNMVALKGGKFLMGSPDSEPHHQANEGPQQEVQIAPFWIGKHEVTWDEFEPYMMTQDERRKDGSRFDFDSNKHTLVDAVSRPTAPFMEMSFGMGRKGYPAISMTQHSANKYCQWLSAKTGHFYRLPTEAEWEYACRAGSKSAYSFGDDPAAMDAYAWHYDNSDETYHKVGLKKPNAWGLHDMHGNVMEWTADQFTNDYFAQLKKQSDNPLLRPTTLYPRSVRGGNWDDDPENLRSTARKGSDPIWKQQDPQLPKSLWYHTDAKQLGFRIVRPLKTPSAEEMNKHWNSASEKR